ncbi:hypothetical protein Hanom_Chr03g00217711 [Helianthus anomalus]
MSDLNSIRWRIKLRTHRKKNRVKRTINEEVMTVSVKRGRAGNLQHSSTNILFVSGRRAARRPVALRDGVAVWRKFFVCSVLYRELV